MLLEIFTTFFVFSLVESYIILKIEILETIIAFYENIFFAFCFKASYVKQKKCLEILGQMKCFDILCSHLVHKRH